MFKHFACIYCFSFQLALTYDGYTHSNNNIDITILKISYLRELLIIPVICRMIGIKNVRFLIDYIEKYLQYKLKFRYDADHHPHIFVNVGRFYKPAVRNRVLGILLTHYKGQEPLKLEDY